MSNCDCQSIIQCAWLQAPRKSLLWGHVDTYHTNCNSPTDSTIDHHPSFPPILFLCSFSKQSCMRVLKRASGSMRQTWRSPQKIYGSRGMRTKVCVCLQTGCSCRHIAWTCFPPFPSFHPPLPLSLPILSLSPSSSPSSPSPSSHPPPPLSSPSPSSPSPSIQLVHR